MAALEQLNATHSFPRAQRLVHSQDFHQVFKLTDFRTTDRYLCILAKKNDLEIARLGLAIAKKKIKTAVARHRVKRLVRESFRQHKIMVAGLDIVVLAQPAAATVDNARLFMSLEKHWEKYDKDKRRDRVF